MLDVEVQQGASAGVAHDHVGLVGIAAEIADTERLPLGSDAAHRTGADDLVMLDIEVIEAAVVRVADDYVGFAGDAAKITDSESLPLGSDAAHRTSADD